MIEGLWFGPTSGSMAVETAFRAAPEIAAQVRAPEIPEVRRNLLRYSTPSERM